MSNLWKIALVNIMSSNRSKPFSGKKKKEQLQLKKQIKNQKLKQENQDELKDGNKNIIKYLSV